MPSLHDAEIVKVGDLLDQKYRVERVLGAGGMGLVVSARHVDLQTRFAIKFMLPDAARDPESVERFTREARAACRLRSEHAVRVHDTGKLDNGAPYMVMEFLTGRDLADVVLQRGPLPVTEAVDYILQACEAIAEAHAIGIVHRDLKLRNLFLTKRVDGAPLVKVLDFGLAKSIHGTAESRQLTHSTAVMGSPLYMSPEQMKASRNVDARTDIWSMAVCLYELISAGLPFDGETVPEICSLVLTEPPSPLPPNVPNKLARIILKCLEKDPGARFIDVAALADALQEFSSMTGSALRIRQVLQSTPGATLESLRPPDIAGAVDAETRTAAAFDAMPTRRRARMQVLAMVGASIAGLAVIGVATFYVSSSLHATPDPNVAASTSPDPPAITAQESPPPTPIVSLDAGAIGAAIALPKVIAKETVDAAAAPVPVTPSKPETHHVVRVAPSSATPEVKPAPPSTAAPVSTAAVKTREF